MAAAPQETYAAIGPDGATQITSDTRELTSGACYVAGAYVYIGPADECGNGLKSDPDCRCPMQYRRDLGLAA